MLLPGSIGMCVLRFAPLNPHSSHYLGHTVSTSIGCVAIGEQRGSMSDDLDAFFDDVSEAEANAKQEDDEEVKEPPLKKHKVVRPRGVVVAAAASSSTTAATTTTTKPVATDPSGDGVNNRSIGSSVKGLPPPPTKLASSQPPTNNQHTVGSANPAPKEPSGTDGWPKNGFRLFVGNLANEVGDSELYEHFTRYASLQRAVVIQDSKKQASKGYGFISFGDALECAKAKREMDQSWLGSRPIRIKKYQGETGQKNKSKGRRR